MKLEQIKVEERDEQIEINAATENKLPNYLYASQVQGNKGAQFSSFTASSAGKLPVRSFFLFLSLSKDDCEDMKLKLNTWESSAKNKV